MADTPSVILKITNGVASGPYVMSTSQSGDVCTAEVFAYSDPTITASEISGKIFTGWTTTISDATIADPTSRETTITVKLTGGIVTANYIDKNRKFLDIAGLSTLVNNIKTLLTGKQDTLTQGSNITISGNTISATDTKNTAGSTNSSSKLYLIGATSQAANPQTYSSKTVFAQDGSFTIGSRKSGTLGTNSYAQGNTVLASGNYSHAEGYNTTASGYCSHAEGQDTIASNQRAHAEGTSTTASATDCHAEGLWTTASATGAHAEGNNTQASSSSAHAEGYGTIASGGHSHAEGYSTIASGWHSHAEGNSTIAQRENQHVEGKYNIADSTGSSTTNLGEYLTIAGNGTADDARSNAYTLDWSGNAWFSGNVYIGSTSGTNKDAGSKKLATENYVENQLLTKQTKIATDLTADLYLVDGTAPTLTSGTYYSNGHTISVNGTIFNDLTDTIFYVDNDIDSGTCLFNKLFGPGYIMAQIWYKEDGETEVYTTYNSNPLLYSNIDTSIPNIARDTRVPSTKLLKDQLALKTDTKNTAGSTDTSNKIYLIGATSQAASPQTYSDNEVYVTSGAMTAKSYSLGAYATMEYNSTDNCIEFNFS